MKYAVVIIATVAVTLGAVVNVHFVLYDEGFRVKLVQKEKMTFDKTFVDARNLNPITWLKLPRPVRQALGNDKTKKFKTDVKEGLDKINKDLKEIFE